MPEIKEINETSKPAKIWLKWVHSATYSGDKDLAKNAFMTIRWAVYMGIAEKVEVNSRDKPQVLCYQILTLCEIMINGCKQGRELPKPTAITSKIGVNKSEFVPSRRWGKL